MASQSNEGTRVVLFPITRRAVNLTALGEVVAALIERQNALPEGDATGRDLIEQEIRELLGLEDQP